MNKYALTVLCLLAAFAPAPAFAQAEDLSQTRAALEAQKKQEAQSAEAKSRAEQKLKDVQKELTASARQSQSIERRLQNLRAERAGLENKQAALAHRLIEDRGISAVLFRTIYQTSRLPPYGLYFSRTPKDEILHRMIALNTTLPGLHGRMRSLGGELQEIRKLQAEIETVITAQQQERTKLKTSSERLGALVKERRNLFQRASAAYSADLKEVARLQKEAGTLEDLMSRLKPAPRPGGLTKAAARPAPVAPPSGADRMMPVVGTLAIRYGETDEIGGKNQGLIFSTAPQALAVSPMAGKVVFAGPFQNFKRLLIIEHFGGYHSLVAGLDHIETNVGSNLRAGEPVGRIDRTSGANGRLYFELRKDGKTVNPETLFKIKTG